MDLLLLPCDPLRPRRPDPHWSDEAAAARELGLEVVLLDHDLLCGSDPAAALPRSVPPGRAVYRGWMLSPAQYTGMEEALADRSVSLVTSASQYAAAHTLPGWFDALSGLTPDSVWVDGPDVAALSEAAAALGPVRGFLKDHSKSLKHDPDASVVPDCSDPSAVSRVAVRFLDLRGEYLSGGLVLRRFEVLDPSELRSWWVGGRCVLVSAHPDTPDVVPAAVLPLDEVAVALRPLALPFVTVDFALRSDGVWRVVELGDGQVSDRPSSLPAADLVAALSSGLASGD